MAHRSNPWDNVIECPKLQVKQIFVAFRVNAECHICAKYFSTYYVAIPKTGRQCKIITITEMMSMLYNIICKRFHNFPGWHVC